MTHTCLLVSIIVLFLFRTKTGPEVGSFFCTIPRIVGKSWHYGLFIWIFGRKMLY